MRTDFSEVKSVFGFRVRLQNPKSRSQNLNPDFPIERNLLYYSKVESAGRCKFQIHLCILACVMSREVTREAV